MKRRPSSAARSPVATIRSARSSSGSKSTSQIHETSRPSAISSLSATTSVGGTPPSSSVRTASFAPAGFLISSSRTRPVADRDPLEAAERGAEPLEPGDDLVERGRRARGRATPRRARCRRCRGRGAASRTRASPAGVESVKATPVEPVRARSRARRRRAAAARGRTPRSGSRRGGRRTRRRSGTGAPQRTQYFESAACWSAGARARRVVDAEPQARARGPRRARRRADRRR